MIKGIIYVVIIIGTIWGYTKYIESRSIFLPMKKVEFTPKLISLPFEDVYIKTRDNVQINGWFIPSEGAKYTILFCHGNGGNIGHRLEKLNLLHKMNTNIFIIDYRGYGRSEGRPGEAGMYLDAQAAYDYLVNQRKISPERIILYGESLGNAAVIDLASRRNVGAVIAEGAFTKGRDMARRVYPFLPAFLFSDNFNSLAKIKQLKAAKLFIHSRNDEIVPFDLGQSLYNVAPEPKQFVELIGGHNTVHIDSQEKYTSSIRAFIEQQSKNKTP